MPPIETSPVEIRIPYGHPDKYSIYIINSSNTEAEFDQWESWRFIKKLNEMGSFEIKFAGIESSDQTTYVKQGSNVKIFWEDTLIFKGRIENVKYEQDFYVTITGFGMEAKLLDYSVTRTEHVQEQTTTIVKQLISENEDEASPWIINEGVNTNWGNITVRGEYENRLRFLSGLANTVNYEWWVSQQEDGTDEIATNDDGYPFNTDYFHFDDRKGDSTAVTTFWTGGATQNVTLIDKQVDQENMMNYVYVLGYGEGINQIKTSMYNASTITSTIDAYLTTTGATVSITDITNFPGSGTIRIGEEQIYYDSTSIALHELYLSSTSTFRGAASTDAKHHPKDCFVEIHFDESAAETGSSIGDNGLRQQTVEDRGLIRDLTAQSLASKLLLDYKDPIERYFIRTDDVRFTGVEVGDTVTLYDTDLSLSTDYRVVGMERGNTLEQGEYLLLECSEVGQSVMGDLASTERKTDKEAKYAMGVTISENMSEKENLDASTDLDMIFYMPGDVIRINKALLSFKLKDFRAYTSASSGGESHSHALTGTTADNTNLASAGTVTTGACTLTVDTPTIADGSHTMYYWYFNPAAAGTHYYVRVTHGTQTLVNQYYTRTTAYVSDCYYIDEYNGGTTCTMTIEDIAGTKVTGEPAALYVRSYTLDHDHSFAAETTDTESAHTHAMSYGIYEDVQTPKTCTVTAGLESVSTTTIGTYTSDQTNVDITTAIASAYSTSGAGWYFVKFQGAVPMRVESNCWIKYFIESKG